jgi:hypothetical protein
LADHEQYGGEIARQEESKEWVMRRLAAVGSLGLTFVFGLRADAQNAAPPLAGPQPAAATTEGAAPAELPPVVEAQPLGAPSAVLAVPGAPAAGRRGPMALPPMPDCSMPGELPPLVGPSELAGSGNGAGGSNPRVINSTPGGSILTEPGPGGPLRPTPPRTRRPAAQPFDNARRPGLFGRRQPPNAARPHNAPQADDVISVEPRSDPAAESALKRRLEEQITSSVGAHLRSYEVRIVDRDITIHARVNRFWYRRSVQRSLESLPGLAGYKTHVEVAD